MFQATTRGCGALITCYIGDRRPRGNYAKPRIECSEIAQKRLEGRLAQPSLLWTGRILERLQAIQNKQGSAMRDELRKSLALLPRRFELWISISKPIQSSFKEFMWRASVPIGALPVKGPAKYKLCTTIVV